MAIQQHPVPQDISNYRFRLIGDMTIRQFASLGIFIILSVVIYGSPIPFFFRYPLAFIFLITGIAMAFIPIQGRTLDVWIIAFIKSIYSPTQYVWKSAPEDTTNTTSTTSTSLSNETTNQPQTPVVPITPPTAETPLEVAPVKSTIDYPLSTIDSLRSTQPISIPTNQPIIIEPKSEPVLLTDKPEGRADSADLAEALTNRPTITQTTPPSTIDDLRPARPAGGSTQPSPAPPTTSLPIPFTPTTPNTIVGLSLTTDNHILDGVMIEIKKDNLTIRATRSNKLGQFLFARPLENGIYQILAEKDGFTFSPYAIELTGEIIRPLKIQAV